MARKTKIASEEQTAYQLESEAQVLAAAEAILFKRLERIGKITDPNDAADFLRLRLGGLEHEEFHVVFLDTRHRIIAVEGLFRGTIDGAEVHPYVVAKSALKHNAAAVEVFVLGRYRRDAAFVPRDWEARYGDRLSVTFMTIHGSKGLEADYVVLPRVAQGSYGFPSTIEDDPVLRLAMPKAEDHPFAEERRLFYVALTRARRGVAIFTQAHRVSPFVLELVEDHKLKISSADGEQVEVHRCAKCPDGVMVPRSGKHGRFWACNRFPACRHTANVVRGKDGKDIRP